MVSTSSSYTITMRLEGPSQIGTIHNILGVIAAAGASIGAIDVVERDGAHWVRDFTVNCADIEHEKRITKAVKTVEGVKVIAVSDETFRMHLGGKLTVEPKFEIKTRAQLSMAYTPGVGRVSSYVAEDVSRAWALTIKQNTIAIVSDGTAVLGLGNLGPEGAMPVMEGKAMLFKAFAGVDAFPLCLAENDQDKIVEFCRQVAPTFGGINLEDISAPRCFYIEERLKELIDIPVFHDDQHGTAVVVLAALKNAIKLVEKKMHEMKVVVLGVGAAGVAVSKILMAAGVPDIIGLDRHGILYRGRETGGNTMKDWFAEHTNPENRKGDLRVALEGADLFIGLSGPGLLQAEWIKKMGRDPIIFAMSNPVPEVMPEEAEPYAPVIATGRSDYPNQINNVLCFPGIFRGALDCRARDINEAMKIAAAEAIADCVAPEKLAADYIIPSVFDKRVAKCVAAAAVRAAHESGIAQRRKKMDNIMPSI
jgi:malate dehydrogenase (oxaloacetate-decarboxylating)